MCRSVWIRLFILLRLFILRLGMLVLWRGLLVLWRLFYILRSILLPRRLNRCRLRLRALWNWLWTSHGHYLCWIADTWSVLVVSSWCILFVSCNCLGCCLLGSICRCDGRLLVYCYHCRILSCCCGKMWWNLTDSSHHSGHHLLSHWARSHCCSGSSLGLIHSWSRWSASSETSIHAHLHLTWRDCSTWLLWPTRLSAAYVCPH